MTFSIGMLAIIGLLTSGADTATRPNIVAASAPAVADADDVLLFTSFRDNGQDGLHLAWSEDGFKWTPLNGDKSVLQPEIGRHKIMRDPCMIRSSDGVFHLVWTAGWGQPLLVGYATSRDLRHWSKQRGLATMTSEPTALNLWAPELFYDEPGKRFLLFWSSTIPGRFTETEGKGDENYNHRAYYTTTRDFEHFEPTKLLYDGGFNCIDATLLDLDGRYALIVKDETLKPVRKHLRMVFSDSPTGPWTGLTKPFTTSWVEGPSTIRIGEYSYVYFDHYAQPPYYGAVRSKDLKVWEDVSKQMSFPPGHRHGSVLRVPRSIIEEWRREGGE